jgi:AraC-like DNA-binding protein
MPPALPRGHRFVYLPITSTDVRRELYVTAWGHGEYRPGDPYPIVQHPTDYHFDWAHGRVLSDFVIVLIPSGSGEYEDRTLGRVPWKAGEVLLLPAGIWHRYRFNAATGWSESWLCLNGEYIHRLRAKGLLPRTALLRKLSDPAAFLAAQKRLQDSVQQNSMLMESRALEVLALAVEGNEASHRGVQLASTGNPLVDRVLEFIWMNSHRPLNGALLAQEVGVTRRTLERTFAKIHSRSIAGEITWCRLQRAKLLLKESRMQVKEVGHATGFAGSKRLIRTFQRELGLTPTEFRNKTTE